MRGTVWPCIGAAAATALSSSPVATDRNVLWANAMGPSVVFEPAAVFMGSANGAWNRLTLSFLLCTAQAGYPRRLGDRRRTGGYQLCFRACGVFKSIDSSSNVSELVYTPIRQGKGVIGGVAPDDVVNVQKPCQPNRHESAGRSTGARMRI